MKSSLSISVKVDAHGALEDGRIGVVRRTLALWCLTLAQRLLKSHITITFGSEA